MEPSLAGYCPVCKTNLDGGGNDGCFTCAGEPRIVTDVASSDRNVWVVIIDDAYLDIGDDDGITAYLTARFPAHRALPVQGGGHLFHDDSDRIIAILSAAS